MRWSFDDVDSRYRGRLLALSFEPGTRDTYGDVEKPEALRLLFEPEDADDRDRVKASALRFALGGAST